MTPAMLRRLIRQLPEAGPISTALAKALMRGQKPRPVWYQTQKEHWSGWLGEYGGPGAYGRKPGQRRSARFIYNQIRCAPMLLWLGEAYGASVTLLKKAAKAARSAGEAGAAQCAAIRRLIPWPDIAIWLDRVG